MHDDFSIYSIDARLISPVAFIIMLLCIYLGRKVSRGGQSDTRETAYSGTVLSAVYGLLAFLLAFTFSMGGSRFDERRKTVVDEANAIGTTIKRTDLFPNEDREAFRKDLQQYLEARIDFYEAKTNFSDVDKHDQKADVYGKKIWDRAAALSHHQELMVASLLMVPAVNEMLDLRTTRKIGELSRVPDSIVSMLFLLSFVSAFFLGYYSSPGGTLGGLLPVIFCLLISVVIFITLDLDRPRRGFIQLDTPHTAMTELRQLFKE